MPHGPNNSLSTGELIRLELDGKNVALGRYDTLIWQIRSGFVIILYGALGLLFKDGLKIKDLDLQVILLVCGFSLLAYAMDLSFRIRQLRVEAAYNHLIDQALKHSAGETVDIGALRQLLHLAGESRIKPDRRALIRSVIFIFIFYASTPLLMGLLRLGGK